MTAERRSLRWAWGACAAALAGVYVVSLLARPVNPGAAADEAREVERWRQAALRSGHAEDERVAAQARQAKAGTETPAP